MQRVLSYNLTRGSLSPSCRLCLVHILHKRTLFQDKELRSGLSKMTPKPQLARSSDKPSSSPEREESVSSSFHSSFDGIFPLSEQDYSFPYSRIRRMMKDSSKIPLVLVACGSFNPVTLLHLRLFEVSMVISASPHFAKSYQRLPRTTRSTRPISRSSEVSTCSSVFGYPLNIACRIHFTRFAGLCKGKQSRQGVTLRIW